MARQQLNSSQIKPGVLTNAHFASNAAIAEAKLNIDWTTRAAEILATKLLVDFVQVNGVSVTVATSATSASLSVINAVPIADADNEKGAVVQDTKNKVVLRNSANGEPIYSVDGTEVYGKLTHNGTDYVVSFFYKTSGGSESAYTFDADSVIDLQYPRRFDLGSISETFAANEKFVDGAADVTSRLDLEQIVKDAFGAGYTLDRDGEANRAKSLVQELTDRTVGTTNTGVSASTAIDELVAARGGSADLSTRINAIAGNTSTNATNIGTISTEIQNARSTFATLSERFTDVEGKITTVKNDLASTANAKGASLIGIEDAAAKFTATTVEAALAELVGRVEDVETLTSSTEVTDARTSTLTGAHADLDTRIEAAETRFEAVKTEVENARGGQANLDTRLDGIDTSVSGLDTRIDTIENTFTTSQVVEKSHEHFAQDKQVLAGDPLINTTRYDLTGGATFVAGDKSLQVYVNGMLQMVDVHYDEVTDVNGDGIAVEFAPALIEETDVIQLRWTK